MALNLVQYEDIVSLLREVAPLVDHLEARRFGFSDEVLAWLKRTETTLEHNRLPVVSHISACRAMLIQAARGVHSNELTFVGKPTVRKVQDATASMVLQRSNELLHAVISERQAVFQEAERISRQIIALAEAKGLLRACNNGRPHQEFLACLQQHVAADADLASLYIHLVALVSKADVLIFFDRAIVNIL